MGEWGKMMDTERNPSEPMKRESLSGGTWADTLPSVPERAGEALGDKYLSFNPVGGQVGIEQANTSRADVLYIRSSGPGIRTGGHCL